MWKIKLIFILTLLTLASCFRSRQLKPSSFKAFSRSDDNPLKLYQVQTIDGYILTLFRAVYNSKINENKNYKTLRPPVLLMHGFMSNGLDFIYGLDQSLVQSLIDNGYDVFVGNTRGSPFGMKHTSLNPHKDVAFWDFSFDEIANIDLPAFVNKVLELTGQTRMSYIGHMEGTMIFYIMLSNFPDYVRKFDRMISLGPIAFMENSPNPVFKKIIDNHKSKEWIIKNLGQGVFDPSEELLNDIETDCKRYVTDFVVKSLICENYYFLIKGYNSKSLNTTTLDWALLSVPHGGSVNQLLHLAQMVKTGRFQTYSPIWSGNIEARSYDISRVNLTIGILYTLNDSFSHVRDVENLLVHLPKVAMRRYFDQLTNNIDLLYTEHVASKVYTLVITFLK